MARPPGTNAEQTRSRILEAAQAVLADIGPRRFGVREVADAADVSVGLVHHYFTSKDGLLQACVEAMYVELGSGALALEDELREVEGVDAQIERAVRIGYAFARRHRTSIRVLFLLIADAGGLETRWRAMLFTPWRDRMAIQLVGSASAVRPELRLGLQTLVFLGGRYAIATMEELRQVTGLDATAASDDEVHHEVEEHLVAAGRHLVAAVTGARSP